MRSTFIWLWVLILVAACGPSGNKEDQAFEERLKGDSLAVLAPGVDDEFVEGVLQQIPSPMEISTLLKEAELPYSSGQLNTVDNLPAYTTSFRKALNLGVYGCDLYYANIYGKNQDGVKLLGAIESLAGDLDIGQFFDMKTISRLASSSNNLDSLLLLTTRNFNDVNAYLQEKKRSELSVLMLTGGWVEAMNILLQANAADPGHPELQEHIGEQKIILEQLLLLYPYYKFDPHIEQLAADLNKLKDAYRDVEIIRSYKESTVEVVNGIGIIKDNSTTTVRITPEQIENIRSITNSVRNNIIR